jgi:hypothetical protein
MDSSVELNIYQAMDTTGWPPRLKPPPPEAEEEENA